jgi:exoribonuclease R
VQRPIGSDHVDRTEIPFITLDPASSIDLDQALWIEPPNGSDADLILHYAIADVGWFVRPGDPLDIEAFQRGVTVYMPDRRATLYPSILSEGAASLLPDADRPAVVFTVRVPPDGSSILDGVQRALVRNHAKLAYDSVTADELPDGFAELYRRIDAAEQRRGAERVEFPEQVVERSPEGHYQVVFRPRLASEEQNAAMSLATNLAVADTLFAAETGLFRVMPEVDERRLKRLRHTAKAFGLDWPSEQSLDEFEHRLDRADPRASAFLMAIRRAAGGASFERYREGVKPWHSAMAAMYAQATAPLRRLQDRYVIEAALAVTNGQPVPDEIEQAFEQLPTAMAHGEQRANRVEREALELAEAVALSGREGQVFDAVVVDESDRGVDIQIVEPAVLARISARHVDPGDLIRVRLVNADTIAGEVSFERVA